jgi:hypothetical protein
VSALFIALPLALPLVPARSHWLQVQDRYAYLSVGGVALLVATLLSRFSSKVLAGVVAVLALLGGFGTWRQIGYWQSNETFWTHTLEVTPTSKPAAINLAYAMYVEQRFAEAEAAYRRGLLYHPNDRELVEGVNTMPRLMGRPPMRPGS